MRLKLFAVLAVAALGLFVAVQSSFAPYHTPGGQNPVTQPAANEIVIHVGNYNFEGPLGISSLKDNPQVIAQIKNGQTVKLIFENVSNTLHQIASLNPLVTTGAISENIRSLAPGQTLEFEITPNFLAVQAGETLSFEIACHVGHNTGSSHFNQGMRAIIEVIP